jgi:SAM-dependent methyltransferase
VSFSVGADAYDRFMGRYSQTLAPRFARFARIRPPQQVVDVGCGPGALTLELVRMLGAESVCAVDPSQTFLAALRAHSDGIDARHGTAEKLPLPDRAFDAALAQLVVHFMDDPVAGLREMARVTKPQGIVAACVWDHAGGRGPLSLFWEAAHDLDDDLQDESGLAGARAGHLAELFDAAGLHEIEDELITVEVEHASFDEWWAPFLLGVGPAGRYVEQLGPERQLQLREGCRQRTGDAGPKVSAGAWAVRARAA